MPWDRKAPYEVASGDLLHYPYTYKVGGFVWKDVVEFSDTLEYQTYDRGRSAAYFWFVSLAGPRYPMFLTDLDKVMKHMSSGGRVTGDWTITKRGQNFGVTLLKATV